MFKPLLAAVGGVLAAVVSALCCAGPLVAVFLGLSGAGLSTTFEPLRPYFLVGSALSLGGGFYWLDREEQDACIPDKPCADPLVRRRMRVVLWIATAFALVFAAFPLWSRFVL